jgi:superoxide dismutase, Fe-Mn family
MQKEYSSSRRQFLKNATKAGLATGLILPSIPSLAGIADFANDHIAYKDDISWTQQPLGYSYNTLEPAIDAQTMEIHYSKHAATYAKSLDEAVKAEKVNTGSTTLPQLLSKISKYTTKMRNNAGGHYNHELFWKSIKAPVSNNAPSGKLADAIKKDFKSFDDFKTLFGEAAKTRFGSGWAWLVYTPAKKLVIGSTPNQDNPLMDIADVKGFPVLGLDVWEHAYYLKYQNKRPDYIAAWWDVVNWDFVEKRFAGI